MKSAKTTTKDAVRYGLMMTIFLLSGIVINALIKTSGITNEIIIIIAKTLPIAGLLVAYIRFPIIAITIMGAKRVHNTVCAAVGTLLFYVLFGVFSVFMLSDFQVGAETLFFLLKALVIVALLSLVEGTVNLLIHRYSNNH